MFPTFIITFREVIEATLIVATILGILVKIGEKKNIKTVWYAAISAFIVSFILLAIGALFGKRIQDIYTGKTEDFVEGSLMTISALFITWAVFSLHNYFAKYKTFLIQKIKTSIETSRNKNLFILTFTSVLREGFEIVLFLSTIYFSSKPVEIFAGFSMGVILGLMVSIALFLGTLKMPVYYVFKVSSSLLIVFAAGLLARGINEFSEAGLIPEYTKFSLNLIPPESTFMGSMLKTLLGLTREMDFIQISLYVLYIGGMVWWVFLRKTNTEKSIKTSF